jgi:hypothetical protein
MWFYLDGNTGKKYNQSCLFFNIPRDTAKLQAAVYSIFQHSGFPPAGAGSCQ